MLPTDEIAAHWAGEHGMPLAGLRAWGVPLVRDGAVLRSAGASDLPAVFCDPDAGPPHPASIPGDVAAIVLHDVADEGDALSRIRAQVPGLRAVWRYECPVAEVGDDVDVYLRRTLSSNRRKKQRRYLRDAEALGSVAVRWVDGAEAAGMFPQFLAMVGQRARLSGRYDPAILEAPRTQRLWRVLGGRSLLISVLEIDGRPVSFRTGFRVHDRFVGYQPAIDRGVEGIGVGHLHLELLLRELVPLGVTAYDFGKGARSSKDVWATRRYDLHAVVLPLSSSLRARAVIAAELARERARATITARGWEQPLRRGIQRALLLGPTGYRRALDRSAPPTGRPGGFPATRLP
jgi:CelD/BcsL family acetyltransferase involved in cellulose biosynthesis